MTPGRQRIAEKNDFNKIPPNSGSIPRMPIPTVNASTTVFEIAGAIVTEDIGDVVVARDEVEPLGILTEKTWLDGYSTPKEIQVKSLHKSDVIASNNNFLQ